MEWPNYLVFFFLFAPLLCLAERTTYIVHLDKSLMPKVFSSHHHWHSSTIDSITIPTPASLNSHHPVPKLLYSYDNVFHGFSAVLSKDELEALKKSPGFVSAYKDIPVELHTTHTSEFLKLNPSSGLWPASNFGQDVIIGVVDTGIWPESPSFKDDGMPEIPKRWKGICRAGTDFNSSLCNRKIIGVNYFYKGAVAASPHENLTIISGRDSWGHGTHIASIAAGNFAQGVSYFGYAKGTARGVAPRARLAIYKVSWRELGSTTSSDIIAGMDQAVADGVDIISMSSGSSHRPLYRDPIAIGAFGAMMKGIFVSGSAGNGGPDFGSLVNGAPWIMTVASGTTDRTFAGTLTLGNGQKIRGWSLFPLGAIIQDSPLVYNKTLSSCTTELLSQVFSPGNEVIVCDGPEEVIFDDGSAVFYFQMRSVTDAGFQAAIFISSDPRAFASKEFSNPGVVIGQKEGKQVKDYIRKTDHPTVSISFLQTYKDVMPAPKLASSSGRGPSRSYLGIAKPDIMAPGESIIGAWPPGIRAVLVGRGMLVESDYNIESGTSNASPHVSGIAAMLKSVHPEWSPSAIKSALMTTANPLDNTQNPIIAAETNEPARPLATGSGFIDPNRALDPGLIYDATPQDYVNLLCSMNFTEEQFKTIARSSPNHNCSNPSADLNYPSFIALWEFDFERKNFPWLVKKFTRTVTNVGSGAAKYTAKVEATRNTRISVSPQVLAFGKKYEKKSYSLTIRYRGDEKFTANYGSITWLEENGNHTVRSPFSVHPSIQVWDS
ncbi:hypothetical protein K7X08_008165 [Anisodus acutangulus]|uniref:Uncharacterized protein n=1 Tax=Anisodus acutangulus TaxID=402998 RepID=A0A9Q1MPX2_9SOLA|nr:hypothetical protein K7X08_008165 [Anisodus acutangulus]